jgi:hypothetical protein
MSNVMNREAIFWTTTTPGYNDSDRQRMVVVDDVVRGKPVKKRAVEKFPQRGHLGDYEDRRTAPGERWMLVVRHDGHEVRAVLTNAAAHMDSATGYGRYVRGKARALGWFDPGQCPCALLLTRELDADQVVSEEVRNGTPCAPNTYNRTNRCPHSIAEKNARMEVTRAITEDREEAMKSKEDKVLEALKEQTEALTARSLSAPEPVVAKSKKGE